MRQKLKKFFKSIFKSSMNRSDLDMSYLTSRILIMSCPTEGLASSAYGNNIDLVKEVLERKHGQNYCIYNLSSKTYRKEKFAKVSVTTIEI
jgi:cyclin G-associated kinase